MYHHVTKNMMTFTFSFFDVSYNIYSEASTVECLVLDLKMTDAYDIEMNSNELDAMIVDEGKYQYDYRYVVFFRFLCVNVDILFDLVEPKPAVKRKGRGFKNDSKGKKSYMLFP